MANRSSDGIISCKYVKCSSLYYYSTNYYHLRCHGSRAVRAAASKAKLNYGSGSISGLGLRFYLMVNTRIHLSLAVSKLNLQHDLEVPLCQ